LSLPTDIIQLFGTSSVPVVVAGTVLAVFELGDRLASQKAKDALSKWLLTFDVRKAGALPDGTKELFERIFGERHFSLKCFVRSAAFSLGAIGFISIVCLLINPHPSEVFAIFIPPPKDPLRATEILIALWLPWSIVIDYVSLFKTRLVLELLLRMSRRAAIASIAILAMDYVSYKFIFVVGIALVMALTSSIGSSALTGLIGRSLSIAEIWEAFEHGVTFFATYPSLLLPPVTLVFGLVLFWAGFAPSIWMWLYVAALFVTRLLLRSEKLVKWLRWALDIEKKPFRSIGAVAATLAFIASVVIILVSAEVSWIMQG
jgi:hypothetical protein